MPRQIGWSQESNLLYNISMQLDRLAAVTAAAGGGGGGTITGGGAAGQVTFWDAATNITGSNSLFWDNAQGRLGIGTNAPAVKLHIVATDEVIRLDGTSGANSTYIKFNDRGFIGFNPSSGTDILAGTTRPITLGQGGWGSYTACLRIFGTTGNVGINSTIDDGINKLQVNGNAKVDGTITPQSITLAPNGNIRFTTGTYKLQEFYDAGNASNSFLVAHPSSGVFNFGFGQSTAASVAGTSLFNFTISRTGAFLRDTLSTSTSPNASSVLELSSTTRGFLPPRMTTTQRNAISTPAAGLTIFNSTNGDLEVYDGNTWEGLTIPTNRQTVNYSLVLADKSKLVEMNVGAANTLTVPPNSSIAFPIGTKIDIAQYGAGQTSIVPGIGVTVRSAGGALKLSAQYSGATIVKIGTDEWYLFGDITV